MSRGWPVLPLKPRDKTPLTRNGLLNASDDPHQIDVWWDTWPEANIGLRTGVRFDVLDIDGPTGTDSMHELVPGYRHPGPTSFTGKGYHLLFEVSGARNGAAMRPGLDFRGQNGYIVAPPSIHPNGHAYRWTKDRPYGLALPPIPPWLADLLTPPAPAIITNRKLPAHVGGALSHLDLAAELTQAGAQLRQRGRYLVAACPFHQDDTPSLVVYPNETFFCFGCQEWGDALNVYHYNKTGSLR